MLVPILTLYAFTINAVTFATNDYRSVVLQAVGVAGVAVALVFVVWRRVQAVGRVTLGLCVLANLLTLFDAAGRRLPAVMGW